MLDMGCCDPSKLLKLLKLVVLVLIELDELQLELDAVEYVLLFTNSPPSTAGCEEETAVEKWWGEEGALGLGGLEMGGDLELGEGRGLGMDALGGVQL